MAHDLLGRVAKGGTGTIPRGYYIVGVIILIALLFYLHPQDLLSFSLPPPQSVRVSLVRVGPSAMRTIGQKTVRGETAAQVYAAVRDLTAVPIGSATGCHVPATGMELYQLSFGYATGPSRAAVENPCHDWVIGSRVWKSSSALLSLLGRIVPKAGP